MRRVALVLCVAIGSGCIGIEPWSDPQESEDTQLEPEKAEHALTVENGLDVNGLIVNGITTNGAGLNGVTVNGFSLNGLALNGLTLNGLALNGLALNGLALNGLALNGLALNGLTLNGLALNGLALNGLALNGLALNGLALNGLALNGLALNGLALNGLALNGLALNGLALNGLVLNGLALNGLALNGAQQSDFEGVLAYLVACALPAGASATVTWFDGTPRTFLGQAGQAPEWASGPLSEDGSRRVAACIITAPNLEIDEATIPVRGEDIQKLKKLLKYLVQCALPPGRSILLDGDTYWGHFGLAPEWEFEPPTPDSQRRVSACLAARANPRRKTVQISLRAPEMYVSELEKQQFGRPEGAFWADLFSESPHIETCTINGGGMAGRVCADSASGCGFTHHGSCATVCERRTENGSFTNCAGSANVVTTYLPFSSGSTIGDTHTCYRRSDGRILCWGDNSVGQLGTGQVNLDPAVNVDIQAGALPMAWPPVLVPEVSDVEQLSGYSRAHTCARTRTGEVYCWGMNYYGNVGNGMFSNASAPFVALREDVAQISTGTNHTCALMVDGDIFCWGQNAFNVLGSDPAPAGSSPNPWGYPYRPSPVRMLDTGEFGVVKVIAGHYNTCILKGNGTIACLGNNEYGQLGDGTTSLIRDRLADVLATPETVFSGVVDMCLGAYHACAIKEDRSLWCWGDNSKGELGTGDRNRRLFPARVVGLPDGAAVTQVACGSHTTCALLGNQEVYCWGWVGLTGTGHSGDDQLLPQGPVLGGVASIHAGPWATCAGKLDGSTWCWGINWGNRACLSSDSSCDTSYPTKVVYATCGDAYCDPSIGESYENCSHDCARLSVRIGGLGRVTSDPAGIDCGALGGTCEATFSVGQVVLRATPSPDWAFVGWAGAGCSGTGYCIVSAREYEQVTARFVRRFQLSVSKVGSGVGTVGSTPAGIRCGTACTAAYPEGTRVSLWASPGAGSRFVGWSGACFGTGTCTVTMNDVRSVTAVFEVGDSFDGSSNEWTLGAGWGVASWCGWSGNGLCYGSGGSSYPTSSTPSVASRTIAIPAKGGTLTFRYRYSPDVREYGSYDSFTVKFGGATLVSLSAGTKGDGTWKEVRYLIPSSVWGTTQIFEVSFHTRDSSYNSGWGAGVDDVTLLSNL